jgi:acetate kinase
MRILAVNAGSSSLRARLFAFHDSGGASPSELWKVHLRWSTQTKSHEVLRELFSGPNAVPGSPSEIRAVGHRVVHGGVEFGDIAPITHSVKNEMARLAAFAPLHNTIAAEVIALAEDAISTAIQFAVFDTGFHRHLPDAARTYPGPYHWLDRGIRRYGFHGINHRYVASRAAGLLQTPIQRLRLITCHLGNGASLAAVANGVSIDTTMGFTPLEGLMMGTRSGSIDPGIVTYLLRSQECTTEELDRVLNEESGLKGLSGVSGDMEEVLQSMNEGNTRARLAFDVYVHRLCREIGGMLASLGGLDGLVFTGGIGENCSLLREIVCRRFEFTGLRLDPNKNERPPADSDVSLTGSSVRVLVIRAEEEIEIARACHDYILTEPIRDQKS